ncbi:hypothetical protein NOJ05_18250 [Neorhizobium galegae]|nr:hypothetical protein [Neorhizobium galegae]MCQ1779149.1 hypothetical protein [Neorhizobium galegae]MCQ1799445.1 hypothetical protein [Neorhizobium galegae]
MNAAHDATALNDPNPFRLALAEAAEIYPESVAAYWIPEEDLKTAA